MRKLALFFLSIILVSSACADEFANPYHWADGRVGHEYYDIPQILLKDDAPVLSEDYTKRHRENGCEIMRVVKADVDNDSKQEYIIAARLEGVRIIRPDGSRDSGSRVPYAAVLICSRDNNYLKVEYVIITGNISPSFQLLDVDKDGVPDIIARGFILSQWDSIRIISFKKERYMMLFSNESIGRQYVISKERSLTKIKVIDGLVNDVGVHRENYPVAIEDWIWSNNHFIKVRETIKSSGDKYLVLGKNIWRFGGLPESTAAGYLNEGSPR